MERRLMKCPHCKHEWLTSKPTDPKVCPNCHVIMNRKRTYPRVDLTKMNIGDKVEIKHWDCDHTKLRICMKVMRFNVDGLRVEYEIGPEKILLTRIS